MMKLIIGNPIAGTPKPTQRPRAGSEGNLSEHAKKVAERFFKQCKFIRIERPKTSIQERMESGDI